MKTRQFSIILMFFSLICPFLVVGQSELLLTNSKIIDQERYKDIQESPYLLDAWHSGSVINQEAALIKTESINFNAFTNTFEVRKGGRFIELDPTWYERIVIQPSTVDSMIFQKPAHSSITGQFMQLLYEGEGQLFKQVESKISKKTFQDVGKTREIERFTTRTTYHWVKDGGHKRFRLSKKNILKTLGRKKEIETFLKKQKLQLKSEADLIQLFAHLDK